MFLVLSSICTNYRCFKLIFISFPHGCNAYEEKWAEIFNSQNSKEINALQHSTSTLTLQFNYLEIVWTHELIINFLVPHIRRSPCKIDVHNKSNTIHNLRNNCNRKQLQSIFSNLTAGTFPNGRLKGYVLLDPGVQRLFVPAMQKIWNGKNIYHTRGTPPYDLGTVTNTILGRFDWFKASIYRTKAPFDGKEAFAIDYKNDLFVFFLIDYLRKVQNNLYLGIATFRRFERNPILFFLLESS